VTDDERAELETLRAEARLFNDALYASVRDYQILQAEVTRLSSPAQSPLPQTPPTPPAD
jgi:hypothetical protein